MKLKKKTVFLAVLAAVLVIGAGAGAAHAYFTARDRVEGGWPIGIGIVPHIDEGFSNWTKHVAITNTDISEQDIFVRARAFYPAQYPVTAVLGENWVDGGDGWYYYTKPLAPGETTTRLDFRINDVPVDEVTEEDFNVTVVFEGTPVQYREDGTADYNDPACCDWDFTPSRGGN